MVSASRPLLVSLFLVPVLVVTAAVVWVAAPPAGHDVAAATRVATSAGAPSAAAAPATAAALPGTGVVIGDSMTWRSRRQLAAALPGWTIDGVGGRKVGRIIPILRTLKESGAGVPEVVVIALGSNEWGWFPRLYQYAVDMLPAETTVVFQSIWRDDHVYVGRDATMRHLTGVMHEVASRREHTCVAPWRSIARRHHDTLVLDGVHPTALGKRVWTRSLVREVRGCA